MRGAASGPTDPSAGADPFGTAAVRDRVLTAWADAPVRFREDANAEEDLALGGYRDRLVVELAQNAADAAARAGTAGRFLLRLEEVGGRAVLVAANTGAPLDATGAESLATLRASAKRGDTVQPGATAATTAGPAPGPAPGPGLVAAPSPGPDAAPALTVGRFGVGFSAVLAVTDEPAVLSRHGGVRFSAGDTRALIAQRATAAPGLAEELTRRDGHVPVLRLPFPVEGAAPDGYDTAVILPLRDAAAEDLVLRLLDGVDDALLLALPHLDEVTVEAPGRAPRTVTGAAGRWHVLRRSGNLDPRLLADRPTEERDRTTWSLTWAVPREGTGPLPGVLYAPTPSEERLSWPGLLIAPFPLDPSRQHVASGPLTEALLDEAADAYADLVEQRAAAGDAVWPLVPVGLAVGAIDGGLRDRVADALARRRLLPSAADPERLLKPGEAVVVEPPAGQDPDIIAALAAGTPDLVAAPRAASAALASLGVRRVALADVVEQLPLVRDPGYWHRLYTLLSGAAADPEVRAALAGLPVPLADGRVVHGVRGVVLPVGPAELGRALGVLGARAVHPQAAHPLLERLGAQPVGPRSALDLPEIRAVATGDHEDFAFLPRQDPLGWGTAPELPGVTPDPGPDLHPVEAVLTVVAAAVADGTLRPGDLDWLGDLVLTDEAGQDTPGAVLALPGSAASRLFHPEDIGVVATDLVTRWGPAVLRAVGVLDGLEAVRVTEAELGGEPPEPLAALDPDDWYGWVKDVTGPGSGSDGSGPDGSGPDGSGLDVAVAAELFVVRDLDAVREDAWPEVLTLLAADPQLRAAVIRPVRLTAHGPSGTVTADVPSPTGWWLRRRLASGRVWADPDADPELARLLPSAPELLAGADPGLRAALGAVAAVADLDATGAATVLDRLADPEIRVDAATLIRVWAGLARLALSHPELTGRPAPQRVRVLDGAGSTVVEARDAVVVDAPAWLQRPDLGAPVLVAGAAEADALADLLDLPLARELADGAVSGDAAVPDPVPAASPGAGAAPDTGEGRGSPGTPVPVPAEVRALLPDAPAIWYEHDLVRVDGVAVDWWVEERGGDVRVHACTLDGLADGLAWAAGDWSARAGAAQLLDDPERVNPVLAAHTFDP